MRRRTKLVLLGLAVLVLGAAGAVAAYARLAGHESAQSERMKEMQALVKQAAPGRIDHIQNGREGDREGGGGGPDAEAYADRAFPATQIAFAQTQNTLKEYRKVLKHQGVRFPRPWEAIGPDTLNVDTLGTQSFGPPTQWSGRITAIAVDPKCTPNACRVYIGAAGGGVWVANNALANNPGWKQLSDADIPTTSIGSLYIDPTDPSGKTIYAGTGEGNGSSDSEAGLGLYKSTDSGNHWSLVPGSVAVAKDRAISAIAVDPANAGHILIGTAVARHGLSSESGGRFTPPGAPQVGLYSSSDGGNTFTLALSRPGDTAQPGTNNGNDFYRGGVTEISYDPTSPTTYYAAMFGYGLFRTQNNGGSFDTIYADTLSNSGSDGPDLLGVRYSFSPAKLPNGKTRIYLGVGNQSDAAGNANGVGARVYRVDDAQQPGLTNAGWTELSNSTDGTPGFGVYDFCDGQCSYDMFVVSPKGAPDTVYTGGVMQYGELPPYAGPDRSDGRAVMRSTDGGIHWTDMTGDARNSGPGLRVTWESMHPDQHTIGFVPNNPGLFFEGSDGGIIRSSGQFTDNSATCSDPKRNLSGVDLADCQQWLSSIPTRLTTLNSGLTTLQFQSLSVNPNNTLGDLLGGTQDNGTLAYTGSKTWFLPVTGDGGDSGIDAVNGNIRFHSYTNTFSDVNFHGNTPASWDWFADPLLFSGEANAFYAPMTQDPVTGGQIFAGQQHVWRTQDSGGDPTFLDNHCNTTGQFGTSDKLFSGECGDWQAIGPDLARSPGTKLSTYVVAIERGHDQHTMWVATRRGRVWISQNADAPDPNAVTFTRIDTPQQPNRYISGISVDPTNPLHAYVTFSGYDAYSLAVGDSTGHVFEATYDPTSHTATWTKLDYDLGDQPVLDVAYDQPTGDLYISTDYGVDRLPAGQTSWIPAADGLPPVAVYGLTLAGGKKAGDRVLYAATHGRGAYRLNLPDVKKK